MRVAFLSYAPVAGGVSTFQALNIDWLVAAGAECCLIDEEPETTLGRVSDRRNTEVERLPVWTDPGSARLSIERWLRKWRPDVVHTSNPALVLRYGSQLVAARRSWGTRVILTHHSETLVPTLRRRLMAVGSSIAALAIDEVTWVSGYTRHWWTRRFPWLHMVQSRITPNGVPLPEYPGTSIAGPTFRVGFVGRLSREKGLDRFIEVAAAMSRKEFSFTVRGDGPERLRLGGGVPLEWAGHLTDPDSIYNGIDILLVTSPVENCPFSVLEARARGIPCVVPPVGGLPEMVVNGVDGVIAASRSTRDLMTAVATAVRDREALARGCLETRWRWTVEKAGERLWRRWFGQSAHAPTPKSRVQESHALR
ncbi:MAG: glycosyltransferase family 4 protein [Gemmatimonadota bacterium]